MEKSEDELARHGGYTAVELSRFAGEGASLQPKVKGAERAAELGERPGRRMAEHHTSGNSGGKEEKRGGSAA